jgi:hypothetical protein
LFPYFSSDLVFDQQNIRRDFAGLAAYDYGSADLEVMVRAYLEDHYGSVGWIRDMLAREPDREPRVDGWWLELAASVHYIICKALQILSCRRFFAILTADESKIAI